MEVTKKSTLTGSTNTMDLPITSEQLYWYNNGMLAQEAFPSLTPPQREFLISGITPDEWDKYFGALES